MCVYVYIQICTYTYITPFLTSLFTLLSEKTQQRKIKTAPHMEINRERRGVGLQIPVPASEPCISLCVRKACVCVGVVKGGSEEPALPTAGLGSLSSFSRVPASLCPLISRPFIAFVYYLLDFMMALRPGTLLAWNCL